MYNAAPFVGLALRSVLGQRHRRLQILVVDDGSSDGSLAAVRAVDDPRIRVVEQHHSGAAAARNRGLTEASGDLIAFLDADDEWSPRKLRRQIAALRADPGLDMVYGRAVSIVGGRQVGPAVDGLCLGALVARADAVASIGPLATTWRAGEFLDWFARAEDAGLRHRMIDSIVLRRRIHDTNLTRDRSALTDYARVLRSVVDRRNASDLTA